MPEKPKEVCKEMDERVESTEKDDRVRNHKERSYYYDDAHGYEKYVDDEGDDENDENGE